MGSNPYALGMARRPTPPRERLLEAARTEFAARGLAGARVDTIARDAEASPAVPPPAEVLQP